MIFDGTTIDALMILGLPDSELAPCKCGRKVYIHAASVCIGTSEYFCEICFPLHRDECGWCAANHFEKLESSGSGNPDGLEMTTEWGRSPKGSCASCHSKPAQLLPDPIFAGDGRRTGLGSSAPTVPAGGEL